MLNKISDSDSDSEIMYIKTMLMALCILLIHADIMPIRQQINWIWSG